MNQPNQPRHPRLTPEATRADRPASEKSISELVSLQQALTFVLGRNRPTGSLLIPADLNVPIVAQGELVPPDGLPPIRNRQKNVIQSIRVKRKGSAENGCDALGRGLVVDRVGEIALRVTSPRLHYDRVAVTTSFVAPGEQRLTTPPYVTDFCLPLLKIADPGDDELMAEASIAVDRLNTTAQTPSLVSLDSLRLFHDGMLVHNFAPSWLDNEAAGVGQ